MVSSEALWEKSAGAESAGSRTPWRKGVCGRDAGLKPTGMCSRRPLHQGVGCPKGKDKKRSMSVNQPGTALIFASGLEHQGGTNGLGAVKADGVVHGPSRCLLPVR